MTRTILFGAAILACLPMVAFGQTKKAASKADVPCCGQAATEEVSAQQLKLETQQNLQSILMERTGKKQLTAGDYLILEDSEGYEFRALVSRQGVVDGWYVADLDGMPVALINNNGGGSTSGGAGYCFTKYSRDVSECARLEQGWPNRYQLCLQGAWSSLWACLAGAGGAGGGVIMR